MDHVIASAQFGIGLTDGILLAQVGCLELSHAGHLSGLVHAQLCPVGPLLSQVAGFPFQFVKVKCHNAVPPNA